MDSSTEIHDVGKFLFGRINGTLCLVHEHHAYKVGDMIFADPPYFLSNGGISVQSGKVVCVDKGEWDKGIAHVTG